MTGRDVYPWPATRLFCLVALLGWPLFAAQAAAAALTNQAYRVELTAAAAALVTGPGGAVQTFRPDFQVLYSPGLPRLKTVHGPEDCPIYVPQWKRADGRATTDYFQGASAITKVSATNATIAADKIVWQFPTQPGFQLTAELTLPGTADEPKITFTLVALHTGCFSVGYAGAPQWNPASLESLWQPPAWQEKRFPIAPILSMEHMCSLSAVMVTVGGGTFGLVADPDFLPFRLPTLTNARCGVLLRNEWGRAQPMFFAPVLGEADSRLVPGRNYTASFRIIARAGGIYESYRDMARRLYGVRDQRQNELCSLNTTIENMIGFALDDRMARWNADLRGSDYSTDVKDTVKVVSALHPMSIAMITDCRDIFDRRALPMTEYLLSREKFLFTTDPHQTGQGASAKMRGPTGEVFEWSSLFHFSQDRAMALRESAFQRARERRALNQNVMDTDGRWVDDLALYRLTGKKSYLNEAERLADIYLARRVAVPQATFPVYAEFWTDFAPRWMQLLELYQDTGEKRYLDAAIVGAQDYTEFCWMSPKVPAGNVTLNMKRYRPGTATVPAWQVSQIGLTPEAANTYPENAAVFLAHFAPFFLRIADLSGDTFFRDIARDAIVGRYANYPGYCISREFSTAYEFADYPTTPPVQNNRYSQFYFNHIWAHIALLMDYLISDAVTRSGGAVDFPSRYAQGYVYLQSKVYGDRPGVFYGDRNVWLYMPRGAVRTDNLQINTVSGRGNGNFYLALMNQSADATTTTVTIAVPGIDTNASYAARVWQENKPVAPVTVQQGRVILPVAGHGITAIAVDGLNPIPTFQDQVLDPKVGPTGNASQLVFTNSVLGQVNGMILTFGRGLSSAYVWLAADAATLTQAKLVYRRPGGAWTEMVDRSFPFEFQVPVGDAEATFEFRIEGILRSNGRVATTETKTLQRSGQAGSGPARAASTRSTLKL